MPKSSWVREPCVVIITVHEVQKFALFDAPIVKVKFNVMDHCDGTTAAAAINGFSYDQQFQVVQKKGRKH